MSVTSELFGKLADGTEISKYWIQNCNGMKVGIINYGAIITNLIVPTKNGDKDIVLGYDTIEPYTVNDCFFGAVVGPNANRICKGAYSIDGVSYQIEINDGENNCHSHKTLGYHKVVWSVETGSNFVILSITDTDGNLGFPGNRKLSVTYTLTDDNELKLHYQGISDKNTVLNPTNHTYFNLLGHASGNIMTHKMQILASNYTPVVPGAIPTGEIATVKGTPLDLTTAKVVGEDIDAPFEQIELTSCYDHNWVIDNADGSLRKCAVVTEDTAGITMNVYTTLPGVQFYAGNFVSEQTGKDGATYGRRQGLCLETQYFPDAINNPSFPSPVFGPDRKYDTTTVYEFKMN